LLKFRVWGNFRFLSHAETMKVFHRACVRGGVEVSHTEGFNPRPRMSLPLPRSVGVESDDELLAFVVACEAPWAPPQGVPYGTCGGDESAVAELALQIQARLADQLPRGCEMISVAAVRGGKTPFPCSASYRLAVTPEYIGDELKNKIKNLLAADSLILHRLTGKKASHPKDVDVRGFVKSIELDDGCVSVECEITSTGSIRMEEILDILGLDIEKLAAPIKRQAVSWQS
jgi:hypothetical protein